MPKEIKTGSILLSAAVFILLEVAALSLVSHSGELQQAWLTRISHAFRQSVWGIGEDIRAYFGLKDRNDELARTNFELTMENLRLKRLAGETADPGLTDPHTEGDFHYIPATVVKMSRNTQHNYIIVNRGYEDGVTPQSGIITPQGVIGIIDMVEKNYSYGITFMNSAMSVSARIGQSGPIGPLTWDGVHADGALLSEIPLQHVYAEGDTVWTSGFSALFPADIPLGTIGTARVLNGAMNQMKVDLFEDLSTVRYVTIVQNIGRDEILSLESMEGSRP